MPTPPPAHLATIRRGTALEAVIRGHLAVVDSGGRLVAGAGDAGAVTTVRSCVKPIQALPLVREVGARLDLSVEEVAIACSSHGGEPVHVAVVQRLLGRAGLDEASLSCGPQLPMDDQSAEAVLAAGGRASRLTNNCSGKHAGMLAVCAVRGWPTTGYAASDHPLQVEIRGIMAGLASVDLAAAPVGIDGCGLPTYGLPLWAVARMFAAASADPGFRRCQDSMAAHPYLVAGRERFDTALLAAAGSSLTVKGGAAGVWVALRRPGGPALAIKLEAGDQSAMSAVAMAALERLGWLDPDELHDPALAGFVAPTVRNWAGARVGEIRAEPGWLQA
ncbi:MAG TPA: asparaginase, partial [Candidatus Dormibacteraeota bacterium]|nr:asparaginase [Candidatus Dormibacteraeota bacterium]